MDFVAGSGLRRARRAGPGVVRRDQRSCGAAVPHSHESAPMWLHGEERGPTRSRRRKRASARATRRAAAAEGTLQPRGGGGGGARRRDAEEMYEPQHGQPAHADVQEGDAAAHRHADLRERAAHRRRTTTRVEAAAGGRDLPSPALQSPDRPRPRAEGRVKDRTFHRRATGSRWNDLYSRPRAAIEGVVTRDVPHGDGCPATSTPPS